MSRLVDTPAPRRYCRCHSPSRHILEVGVMVAKVSLLLVRQTFETMIALTSRSDAVLMQIVQYTEGGQSQDDDLRSKID